MPGTHISPRGWLVVAFALALVVGCDKVTEDECRQAIANIDRIYQREATPAAVESAVRSCRAFSSRGDVECWSNAKTEAELSRCSGQQPAPAGGDATAK